MTSALKKNSDNLNGTGGGAGETFSKAEEMVLNHMKNRDSDLVEGITGGFESALPVPRVIRKNNVNKFLNKARSVFDVMSSDDSEISWLQYSTGSAC